MKGFRAKGNFFGGWVAEMRFNSAGALRACTAGSHFRRFCRNFGKLRRGGGLVEMRGRATKEGNLEGMVTRLRWLADWDEQAGHHERLSRRDGGPFPLVGWLG